MALPGTWQGMDAKPKPGPTFGQILLLILLVTRLVLKLVMILRS